MRSRRDFLAYGSAAAIASAASALATPAVGETLSWSDCLTDEVSLDGQWGFRLDPDTRGESENWFSEEFSSSSPLPGWASVLVPHTWQITPGTEEFRGLGWYRRAFEALPEWQHKTVRVEFEAVFHSATIWVNGKLAGSHLKKGYTAFTLEITSLLRWDRENLIVVKVENAFNESMLPRGHSSDWAHDGGIYRPVRFLITPQVFIEHLVVEALPDIPSNNAAIEISAVIQNKTLRLWQGELGIRILEEKTGRTVLEKYGAASASLESGKSSSFTLPTFTIQQPLLWHFDHPDLYSLTIMLSGVSSSRHRGRSSDEISNRPSHKMESQLLHEMTTTFGIRTLEVKDAGFYLNDERVKMMGVERMAGSNPEFGMAEPAEWIEHDHRDLKELNCIFTRVHWPQDRRVLDYCDRHGILLQSEIPTWGPDTFQGMEPVPLPTLMQNGLEQLREMIERDRNHPCIISWGLCNEIGGQNPPAYRFAKRMLEEAKKLNPRRLCTYASNSLQKTASKDVAALMDFIEWNEYYESWYGGTPEDLRRNLKEIHEAFPDKPIVISEYGYCACTPDRPEGDVRRSQVLRDHTAVARELDFVGGLIFFCYNDYRTHIGDKGIGAAKQRIHGVVDLYGNKKLSYDGLRGESSPIESLEVSGHPAEFAVTLTTRNTIPAYQINGYKVRAVFYGYGEIPLERREAELPPLGPGERVTMGIKFSEKEALRVEFDVLRSTGFSSYRKVWRA